MMKEKRQPIQHMGQSTIREASEDTRVVFYWLVVKKWWKLAVLSAIVGGGAALVLSMLVPAEWRAAAVLKPTGTDTAAAGSQLLGGFGAGVGLISGLTNRIDIEAAEYVAILRSYDFTMRLMSDRALYEKMFPGTRERPKSKWKAYKRLLKRLDCDYDRNAQLLTVSFLAATPNDAREILTRYIKLLRDELRQNELSMTEVTLSGLNEEARKATDPVLRASLYALIAERMQHQQVIRAQADFGFREIDSPVTPDSAAYPRPVLYAGLTALVSIILVFGAALLIESAVS